MVKTIESGRRIFALAIFVKWCLALASLGVEASINQDEKDFFADFTLEELLNVKIDVVTKSSEESRLAPAIVTVILAEDIQRYGYTNLADVLSRVAGFVDNYDQALHNFGVRGINSGIRSGSRTIKIMLNEQAIAFDATSQNFIGNEFIPLSAVKRVEIIRGPVSALYGANSFLAVVNIVTKQADEIESQGKQLDVSLSQTEWGGRRDASLVLSGKLIDWSVTLASQIGAEQIDGLGLPRRSPGYELTSLKETQDNQSRPMSLYFTATNSSQENGQWKVSGLYQELDKDHSFTYLHPLPDDGTSRIALNNMFVRLDYERNSSDTQGASAYFVYKQGDTLGEDKQEVDVPGFYFTRRLGYQTVESGAEMHFDLESKGQLLVGADVKASRFKIETFTRVDRLTGESLGITPERNEDVKNIGGYLQYSTHIATKWRGIVGVRYDDDSIIGEEISSRLGLVRELPEDWVFKFLFGSSFQAPSSELLFRSGVQAGDIIGNENLKTQDAQTLDMSLSGSINDNLHVAMTLFNTRVKDLVVFTSDGNNLFAKNSAEIEVTGLELESRWLWGRVNGYLNYTWVDVDREAPHFSLLSLERRRNGELYPEQHGAVGISYDWQNLNTQFSIEARWLDTRPASYSNVMFANQDYQLDAYTSTNITVATRYWSILEQEQTRMMLRIKDVFDVQGVSPGFGGIEYPSLGRQIEFSLEQRF